MQSASSDARVLSIALVLMADDYGNGRLTRSTPFEVFPSCESPPGTFGKAWDELDGWYARSYKVRGQRYFQIVNWCKHQRVDKPGKPLVPAYSENPEESSKDVSRESRDSPVDVSPEPRESLAPDLDLDLDLDLDRDLTRERARAATPTNFSRTAATASFDTEGVVKREFISHFVEATGCEWLPGPHGQAVFDLAVSVAGQAKRDSRTAEEVLAQTLKHFFADEWVKQRVYPIRHLSGNFARYYNPPRRPESEAAYSTPEERDARMQKIFDGIAEENRKKGLLK